MTGLKPCPFCGEELEIYIATNPLVWDTAVLTHKDVKKACLECPYSHNIGCIKFDYSDEISEEQKMEMLTDEFNRLLTPEWCAEAMAWKEKIGDYNL